MKLTEIVVGAWNSPNSQYTYITRHYTNPGMKHMVRLYPNEVETYLYKGDIHQAFEPGIHHMARPL